MDQPARLRRRQWRRQFGAPAIGIGFLGFGLHYPNMDWGDMLSSGTGYLSDGYWWLIWPILTCIVLTVMALNFIGDALRDSLDVRLRRR